MRVRLLTVDIRKIVYAGLLAAAVLTGMAETEHMPDLLAHNVVAFTRNYPG